jgi:glutamate dehydrogenase/leucine dehydrogenase
MKACAKFLFGVSSLEGLTVAIQGVGSVGSRVVKQVMAEGVKLIITDLNYDCLKRVQDSYPGVQIVHPDEILSVDCDILSPCALGPIIGDHNIDDLKCKIIVGAAYNIFENRHRHSKILYQKGILCAPDFVANSAEMFLTECALELLTKEEIDQALKKIYEIMGKVLALSKKEDLSPYEAALQLAEDRIRRVSQMKGILC